MGGQFGDRSTKTVATLLANKAWHEERKQLRAIVLECDLLEELKWGKLCYTHEGNNVAMIYGLKENCALGFLKGALLKDPKGVLLKPGENSQAARWIKFTDVREIARLKPTLKAYLREAIAVEKAGLTIDFKEKRELVFPEELQKAFKGQPAFKAAFDALTPGRQRGYNLYFSAPKQSKTRVSRIESNLPRILEGKGRNDR